MSRFFRSDTEIEVLGFHLTVRRIVLALVVACLLVLAILMISEILGEEVPEPPINNETGRYEETEPNWALCSVFIFLGLVVVAVISLEIRS